MNESNFEVTILILIAILIPLIVWIYFNFRQRSIEEIQLTLRTMIEKGHHLSPELLNTLDYSNKNTREKDLRRGVRMISLGLAIFVMGLFIGEATRTIGDPSPNEFSTILVGIALAFAIMGLTYIGFWKFMPGKDNGPEYKPGKRSMTE